MFCAFIILACALTGFVYRKRIVERFIKATSYISPIGLAHAQSNTVINSVPNPAKFSQYQIITHGQASLIPQPGILGFSLRGKIEKMPDTCEETISPFFQTIFILSDITDEDFYLKLNRCLKESSSARSAMKIGGKSWVAAMGPLQIPISSKEKKLIDSIHRRLAKKGRIYELVKAWLQSGTGDKKTSKAQAISKIAQTLEEMEKSESLLSRIAQIGIYADLGNQGKVDALIIPYLKELGDARFFREEYLYMSSDILEQLAKALGQAQKKMGKSRMFNAFLLKLYGESSPQMRSFLEDETEISLKESQLLRVIKSPSFGVRYPLVWTWWVMERLGKKKQEELFERVPISSNLENLQILRYTLPLSEERRAGFQLALERLLKRSEPERRALYFDIMKNEKWSRYSSSHSDRKGPPLFKLKRDFYSRSFAQERGILFSVYQLFSMGDFQREHFLKVLAVRTYGFPAAQFLPL